MPTDLLMKNAARASSFLTIVVCLLGALGTHASAEQVPSGVIGTPINIRKYPTASLTEADSASILAEANGYLAQCKVTLSQVGNVLDAPGSPSVINSQADLNQACGSTLAARGRPSTLGTPRRYRIVNAINWCGKAATGGTILGCTPTPGTCVVQRRWGTLEGQVLAHEFGHSKGLQHRTDMNAVMYQSIGPMHTEFNLQECSVIRQLSLQAAGQPVPQNVGAASGSIEEFVSQVYPDGIPYADAARFTAADVARVAPWLKDDAKAPFWSNVATVTGIVADSSAFEILDELINRNGSGKLPIEQYDGRIAAIMALGYVVKNNGSADARQFLESHSSPSAWAGVRWLAPYHVTDAERNTDLAAAAALGLSRAADPAAVKSLNARLNSLRTLRDPQTPQLRRALRQGIMDAQATIKEQRR